MCKCDTNQQSANCQHQLIEIKKSTIRREIEIMKSSRLRGAGVTCLLLLVLHTLSQLAGSGFALPTTEFEKSKIAAAESADNANEQWKVEDELCQLLEQKELDLCECQYGERLR